MLFTLSIYGNPLYFYIILKSWIHVVVIKDYWISTTIYFLDVCNQKISCRLKYISIVFALDYTNRFQKKI